MKLNPLQNGTVTIVPIELENLDADNSKEFKAAVTQVIEKTDKLVFDLARLQFIDSSGLGAILSCQRTLHEAGGDLKLCNMSGTVRAMFELVRMHRVVEIYNNREEAVASFTA